MSFLKKLFGGKAEHEESPLDYDAMHILDAEDLAEQGIKSAYDDLLPALRTFVECPAEVVESVDEEKPSYSISVNGIEHLVYSADHPGSEEESWGRATYILFALVNQQLTESDVSFYAINGGNDLGGMFLTKEQVDQARRSLPQKSDWPYLPTSEAPYYGQFH